MWDRGPDPLSRKREIRDFAFLYERQSTVSHLFILKPFVGKRTVPLSTNVGEYIVRGDEEKATIISESFSDIGLLKIKNKQTFDSSCRNDSSMIYYI